MSPSSSFHNKKMININFNRKSICLSKIFQNGFSLYFKERKNDVGILTFISSMFRLISFFLFALQGHIGVNILAYPPSLG